MNIKFLNPYLSIIGILLAISCLNLSWTPVAGQRTGEEGRTGRAANAANVDPQIQPMAMKTLEQTERPEQLSQNSCNEYIINGDFEDNGAWSFEGNAGYDENYASSGKRFGFIKTLHRDPGESSSAGQTVKIPESYESITIEFDTLSSETYLGNDISVAIYDDSLQNQLSATTLSYDIPYQWSPWDLIPPVDLSGQTIHLVFSIIHNNEFFHTSANFDNVSMIICETPVPTNTPYFPPPAPTPTNTWTNTPAPTATSTATPTNTWTNTPSPTATPTNMLTNTPEPPATPTNALTNTPEPTATPTSTPTRTPSSTPYPTATSTDTSTATSTATPSRTYTPTHTPNGTPGILNLRVAALEINQSIQTSESSVPLIADRPAMARVFIDVQNSTDSVSGVTAHLYGIRNGEVLQGSPLAPFNLGQSIEAPSTFNQRNFNDSLNFRLPLDWTQAGQTQFWVEVNPDGTVEEGDDSDNLRKDFEVEFKKVPPLEIVLIPIVYQKNGTGPEYRPDMNADNNWGLGMLHRTYPVSDIKLERHPEYLFQGDMATQADWSRLLKEILNLRTREQPNSSASATSMPKYYGVLPREARLEGAKYNNGLAYKSGTAAIGLVDAESSAAHQLGHNFGLLHVEGCGRPAGIDEEYPHAQGIIGHIGMDIIENRLISDIDYHDLMSYCSPKWISNYHYHKIFDLMVGIDKTTVSISRPSLLISGRIAPDRTAKLEIIEPLISAATVKDTGRGAYKLELIDQNNIVQFIYNFDPMEIAEEEHGKEPMGFSLIVPQIPNLKHIQILRGTEILDEMAAATVLPTLSITHASGPDPSDDISLTWEISSVLRSGKVDGATVNIRYSPDEGESWQSIATELAVNEFKLKRSQLPASANGLIEVIAVDRNQVATEPIEIGPIANKAPEVGIIRNEKIEYYAGEPIFLKGRVTDFEDGTIPDDRLRWFVGESEEPSGPGQTLLHTKRLNPGTHTIKLVAEDSAGETTEDSITITVYLDGQQIFLPFFSR